MGRIVHSPYLILAGIAVVLGVAFLSGHRPAYDEGGSPIIVYAHPPCPPHLMELYRPVWNEFRRTHPGINFRVLHVTGIYEDKIKIMIAGKVAPDVVFMYPTALPAWVELDALEPLDAFVAQSPNVSPDDYFEVMLDTFSYNGRLYGLPKDASASIVEYNVDLFNRYGLEHPQPDWTWDDLLKAGKALTRDLDGDGRIDQWGMNQPLEWWAFVWQNGGRVLDESGTRCMLLEPEAVEALEFWAALRWQHGVTPTPAAAADVNPFTMFALERVAMDFAIYPVVSILRKTCDFQWDLAHMPRGPHARATTAMGSAMAITTQSRNKEAAFEFIWWMTSPAGMRGLVSVESPSCIALAESPAFLESAGPPPSKHIANEAMKYARRPFQHPLYYQILDILNPELDKALRGRCTVCDALENAVPEVNRALDRYAQQHPLSGED